MTSPFQAGGTLQEDATYLTRRADEDLYAALVGGEYCVVLAPRQIGKSSLKVRTACRLAEAGYRCASIDLTEIGSRVAVPEWYLGMLSLLSDRLGLPGPEDFWNPNEPLSPIQRFIAYLVQVVLPQVPTPIVVFLDEIETLLGTPVSRDDFFAAIRALYNNRAEHPEYRRLTFCIIGVLTPGELIEQEARTPFNIGQYILLEDFTWEEMQRGLLAPLSKFVARAEDYLFAINHWTRGHPYMTQAICLALAKGMGDVGAGPAKHVEELVSHLFMEEGIHYDRYLVFVDRPFTRKSDGPRIAQMLRLYGRILEGELIIVSRTDPIQTGLRLFGMVAERRRDGKAVLDVRNPVLAALFDAGWVKERGAMHFLAEPLSRWLESGRRSDDLLRGGALEEARHWMVGREDITSDEQVFIRESLELSRKAQDELERSRGAKLDEERRLYAEAVRTRLSEQAHRELRRSRIAFGVLAVLVGMMGVLGLALRRIAISDEECRLTMARYQTQSAAPIPDKVDILQDGLSRVLGARLKGYGVAFSSDGQWIATGSDAGRVQIFEALSGRFIRDLTGQGGVVRAVVFSPSGDQLASGEDNGSVCLWRLPAGTLLVLKGHLASIGFVDFSPDGLRLISGGADQTIRIWDTRSGRDLYLSRTTER